MAKNYQFPPLGMPFYQLFEFIVSNGVGNEMLPTGAVQPWEDQELIDAFETLGDSLNETTIRKWKSGETLASPKKLSTLAVVVGASIRKYVEPWSRELGLSRNRQWLDKKKRNYQHPAPKQIGYMPSAIERVGDNKDGTQTQSLKKIGMRIKQLFSPNDYLKEDENVPSLLVENTGPYISKLFVCDERNFEVGQNACSAHMPNFPLGIKKVFLSFVFHNMPTGKRFKRSWYRNGEKFREKLDYYDDAWPGYTYLWNESGHDSGRYVVRISVDERSATTGFIVGR